MNIVLQNHYRFSKSFLIRIHVQVAVLILHRHINFKQDCKKKKNERKLIFHFFIPECPNSISQTCRVANDVYNTRYKTTGHQQKSTGTCKAELVPLFCFPNHQIFTTISKLKAEYVA